MPPQGSPKPRVAVIGAGIAGIACARRLQEQGFASTLFEKSRGLGGRLATRRLDGGLAFDHGAQYVTARSPSFRAMIEAARASSAAAVWRPRGATGEADWMVGAPSMNGLVKSLAEGLEVRLGSEVMAVARHDGVWRLDVASTGSAETFDLVVCTAPAPQARALFADRPEIADALAGVTMAPCWALMLAFAAPLDSEFDVWRSRTHDLAWVARNASKPGRESAGDCWVVHASPDWSARHLELDRDRIAELLVELLPDLFSRPLPEIALAMAHRWRYAMTTAPLGRPFVESADCTLFVGGDWCLGVRVEAGFESGRAIAERIAMT